MLLRLLADYPDPGGPLLRLVDEIGGVELMTYRFMDHYEVTSPFTLFELGFNFNHTKAMLRLLRNRGVLAAMPLPRKVAFATWLATGAAVYSVGAACIVSAAVRTRGLSERSESGLASELHSMISDL